MAATLTRKFKPLTPEEETLVLKNIGFAHQIAAEHCNPKNENFDDFIQVAKLGLMEAAKRYDPSLGLTFLTYAVWWIRQKCITQSQDRVVRRPINHFNRSVRFADIEMAQQLGRFPTLDEVFDRVGVSQSEGLNQVALFTPDSSMDYQADGFDDTFGNFFAPTDPTQEDQVDRERLQKVVKTALKRLDPRSRDIVLLRQQGWTLKQIGEKYDLTRERIRQIENSAFKKLREALLKKQCVKDYFEGDSDGQN